jgi:hypothetical protein
MRKYLLGAAAALALAAPGVASAQSTYVDLGYQTGEIDAGGPSADFDGWTLGGAAAFSSGGPLGFQVDGVVGNNDVDSGGDVDFYTLGGHAFVRNQSYLFGGFANIGNADGGGGADFDYWTVGAEGQYYLPRTTLDGALSYSEADDFDGELTAVDLGATHFINDNFSVGGNVGFGNLDIGAGDDDILALGVNTEYQFSSLPISLFAGYQHAAFDDSDIDTDQVNVGVRYNFGGTLFERNRSGASLSRGGGFGRFGGLL